MLEAVQARGDQARHCEIRVDVAAGHPVLEPERRAVAHDPEGARAVVRTPRDRGRCKRLGLVALVRVDVRREQQREVALAGELAREEVLHLRRETVRAVAREDRRTAGVAQAEVDVARVALALVELRHERERHLFLRGDLLRPRLVDRVVVARDERVGEEERDLVLAEVALPLRRFDTIPAWSISLRIRRSSGSMRAVATSE